MGGDHLLTTARAFAASADGDTAAKHDAVWFDVLALTIVSWRDSWSPGIALFGLVLVCAGIVVRRRIGLALFAGPFVLASALLGALVAGVALQALGAIPAPWVAHPGPAIFSVHAAAAASGALALLVASRIRSLDDAFLHSSVWLTVATLGFTLAVLAPGASFLFAVPALVAGIAGLVPRLPFEAACAAPVLATSALWFPIGVVVYDALGFIAPAVLGVSTAMLIVTLSPLLRPFAKSIVIGASVLACVSAVSSTMLPEFSDIHPQRVNVFHLEDEQPQARVLVDTSWGPLAWGQVPDKLRVALGASASREFREPVLRGRIPAVAAHVPRVNLPPPEVTVVSSTQVRTRRHLHLRLQSRRGASTLMLGLPPGRSARIVAGGIELTSRIPFTEEMVVFRAAPLNGLDVQLSLDGSEPFELLVIDSTGDLPSHGQAAFVAGAREVHHSPYQDGDETLVMRRVRP